MTLEEVITPKQMKQFGRFVEDAGWKAIEVMDLSKQELQLIIEHGNEIQIDIVSAIEHLVKYVYPAGYHPKSITEQTNILREFFPGIGYADEEIARQPLPEGAEAWFAIPRWENIAPTYNEAVQKVLYRIEEQRKGKLKIEYKLGPQYLRQHAHKVQKLQIIAEQQKGYDILVVSAQFGLRYKGWVAVRDRFISDNEFGLGAYEGAIMLLTHPERLIAYRSLFFDCPGDEMTINVGDFSEAGFPWFLADGEVKGGVKFRRGRLGYSHGGNGYITGFLPK